MWDVLILGVRRRLLGSAIAEGITCPKCGVTGRVQINRLVRIFTFFFLPLFPVGTSAVGVCLSCGATLRSGDLKEDRDEVKAVTSQFGLRIEHFWGLAVIAALILIGVISAALR